MKHTVVIALLLGCSAPCLPAEPAPRLVPRALAFAADGRTLAAGSEAGKAGELTLWDVRARRPRWTVPHPAPVRALAWMPDGKTLVAAVGPSVLLVDPATGTPRGVVGRHGKWIACLALTADGLTLATGGDDGSIKLWDIAGKKERRTIQASRGWVTSVCFSPQGKRLVSTADEEARLWDTDTGKPLQKWAHGGFLVRAAVFTPDGKEIVTAGWDGSARLWDAQTGALRARFRDQGGLDGALLQMDAHTLALWGYARTIVLFDFDLRPPDAATKQRIVALLAQLDDDDYARREAASKALESLGWVATAALQHAAKESKSAEVRIRARTALAALQTRPRCTLKGHTGTIRAVCFSKDGQTLASGGDDGSVRLWDRAGRVLAVLGTK
jgi:WD40 repeat protein